MRQRFRTQARLSFGIACIAMLQACHLGRATKSDPGYLRARHAGFVTLSSEQPARALFERMSHNARTCYVGGAVSGVMPAGPGLFVPISGPGREIEAKFDEANRRGFVRGFIDGNIYLPMFQIDISEDGARSRVDVYYGSSVGIPKAVPENVKAWLAGNDAACSFKSSKSD
ncbi:MAG: hypothetical protein EOP90_02680 [Lysobacteraceae bacterium]|nr:MAG: hypothetical protein EOP90_02680 [Xanthomonadaceae bacterium]